MKKYLSILLLLVLTFALTACGGGGDGEQAAPEEEQETAVEASEPLNPTPGSVTIGDVTLTAELVTMEEAMPLTNATCALMAVSGDTVYIGDGSEIVNKYTLADNTLTLVKSMSIPNRDNLCIDNNGQLLTNGGVFAATIYDAEGNQVGEAVEAGKIYTSQTQDFALTYFTGNDAVMKISGGAAAPWVISGLAAGDPAQVKGPFSSISAIDIVGDHVLVAGYVDGMQKLVVFDTAGNEVARSSEELFGNGISALTETANGYMTASVSTIHLTAKDGTFIGKSDSTLEFFGVEEAVWLSKFVPMDDGSVLAVCGATKADGTAQVLVYRIKGF